MNRTWCPGIRICDGIAGPPEHEPGSPLFTAAARVPVASALAMTQELDPLRQPVCRYDFVLVPCRTPIGVRQEHWLQSGQIVARVT